MEAEDDAKTEPLLSSFLYASILAHDTFERALAFVLANRLASTTMLSTELFELFHDCLKEEEDVSDAAQGKTECLTTNVVLVPPPLSLFGSVKETFLRPVYHRLSIP